MTRCRLPFDDDSETYAAALRLRVHALDDEAIAAELGLETIAVGPLLHLDEAGLATLERLRANPRNRP